MQQSLKSVALSCYYLKYSKNINHVIELTIPG